MEKYNLGGRGSTLRSKQETLKHEKEKPKAQKLEKDQATGVYKGDRMPVDQADNTTMPTRVTTVALKAGQSISQTSEPQIRLSMLI